jgi:exonuclease VII large subunit
LNLAAKDVPSVFIHGNISEIKDALNNSSYFEYDKMDRLVKVTLWRKDGRHYVNEAQKGTSTNTTNAA